MVRYQNGTLPHALLYSGVRGLGKHQLAQSFVHILLCEQMGEHACGHCHACHLLKVGHHPDLYTIGLEDKSAVIKIDQIRYVIDRVQCTAQLGGYQIVLIDPAEMMNRSASAALLKVLEEPPNKVLFILVSHQLGRLPATISSRCQSVLFSVSMSDSLLAWFQSQSGIGRQQAIQVLRLACGGPLLALQWVSDDYFLLKDRLLVTLLTLLREDENPLDMVKKFLKESIESVIYMIWMILKDSLWIKYQATQAVIFQEDLIALKKISVSCDKNKTLILLDIFQQAYICLTKGIHLNHQLLLEKLFLSIASYHD